MKEMIPIMLFICIAYAFTRGSGVKAGATSC